MGAREQQCSISHVYAVDTSVFLLFLQQGAHSTRIPFFCTLDNGANGAMLLGEVEMTRCPCVQQLDVFEDLVESCSIVRDWRDSIATNSSA